MLVTLRVWFTSFQGVIDDQDTSVKRYGYFFYFISCFQLVFLSPYSLRHIIHTIILEKYYIVISFCGQFCATKVMLFCSDAVVIADKLYLKSNQQTNKYIKSLLMHFSIRTCLRGSIVFHCYRLQAISTVYKAMKTLKYNTWSENVMINKQKVLCVIAGY